MANKYLITTEPSSGNLLYFSANASGELIQIESQNFDQGFTDTELALLNNGDYASLANGKLLIHTDAGVTPVVDITPVDYGIVQTTPITAIDLHGYSGINGISINGVGGKFAVSFDSGESWKSRINGTWQAISPGDIETQGMSKEDIQSLQPADWAQVFLRTQLDIMCYLDGAQGNSLTSFVVSLPPNSGPNIINVAATPDNMHKEDVIVSCKIYDPEEDDIAYKTFFNGAEYQGVRGVPADGYVNIAIPSNLFVIGLNAVRIEATDARGLKTENTVFITRTNIAPIITGVLSGNIYRAVVEDPDNDNVQYRILFNGIEKVSWTNLNQSPATIIYEIDKREINFGIINTLRVEFRDEFQELGFTEEQFVGSYYGILFTNLTGDFYSTDLGEIIQKLDFGTLIAGQISVPKEVYVVNKCGFDLKNLTILTSPELPTNVYVELSVDENPFTPTNSITVGTLMQNEKKSIFVRIRTTKASYGGGDFDISAKADPA